MRSQGGTRNVLSCPQSTTVKTTTPRAKKPSPRRVAQEGFRAMSICRHDQRDIQRNPRFRRQQHQLTQRVRRCQAPLARFPRGGWARREGIASGRTIACFWVNDGIEFRGTPGLEQHGSPAWFPRRRALGQQATRKRECLRALDHRPDRAPWHDRRHATAPDLRRSVAEEATGVLRSQDRDRAHPRGGEEIDRRCRVCSRV
jgi:hypothetical protein